MSQPTDPDTDMRQRWQPASWQLAMADAIFAADQNIVQVIVPLALPHKTYGIWVTGQAVEPVNGFWPVTRKAQRGDPMEYGKARNMAEVAAEAALGDLPGVPSFAVIRRERNAESRSWAVFEGYDQRLSHVQNTEEE